MGCSYSGTEQRSVKRAPGSAVGAPGTAKHALGTVPLSWGRRSFRRCTRGAATITHALLLGVIGIVGLAAAQELSSLSAVFDRAGQALDGAVSAPSGRSFGPVAVSGVLDTRSCAGLLASDPSTPSGLYIVDPDGASGEPGFIVWCDMESDGGGWTLVESFARHQAGAYAPLSFTLDAPRNAGEPDSSEDHRLPVDAMGALQQGAREFRITCNMGGGDHIQGPLASVSPHGLDLTDLTGSQPVAVTALSARGQSCPAGTVTLRQGIGPGHLHLLASDLSGLCPAAVSGALPGEQLFGGYQVSSTAHSCTATTNSTTNTWVR